MLFFTISLHFGKSTHLCLSSLFIPLFSSASSSPPTCPVGLLCSLSRNDGLCLRIDENFIPSNSTHTFPAPSLYTFSTISSSLSYCYHLNGSPPFLFFFWVSPSLHQWQLSLLPLPSLEHLWSTSCQHTRAALRLLIVQEHGIAFSYGLYVSTYSWGK